MGFGAGDEGGFGGSGRFGIKNAPDYGTISGAAPIVRSAPAPTHGIKVSQRVFHNKFGEGTVLLLEGSGDDARAQINFPRHGVKWLALAVAKLTPVT